jgi:hypothetical protein
MPSPVLARKAEASPSREVLSLGRLTPYLPILGQSCQEKTPLLIRPELQQRRKKFFIYFTTGHTKLQERLPLPGTYFIKLYFFIAVDKLECLSPSRHLLVAMPKMVGQ